MTDVPAAVDRAAIFLGRAQSPDGMWRDFETLAGPSSEWVTAFVVNATAASDQLSEARARAGRELLRRQRPNGGWAYNHDVPTDADSTAWSLLALGAVGLARPSAVWRATEYLARHQSGDGGFSTYGDEDEIHRFIEVDRGQTQGWLGSHSCVTGVALAALLLHRCASAQARQRAEAYLLSQTGAEGLWDSYWWRDPTYSTFVCLRALLLARALPARGQAAVLHALASHRCADAGRDGVATSESRPFATAFACLGLLLIPRQDHMGALERGIARLEASVEADGSVESTPILRIPPPMIAEPERTRSWRTDELGTGVVLADRNRIFTTAAALWALTQYQSTMGLARP